jgi:hypothetical protein
MADLPKIDSTGLRLAKLQGAERVSSVTRITIRDKAAKGQASQLHRNEVGNGSGVVRPTGGRKESR